MGEIIGPPRCGIQFHVREGRTSQLQPGSYPCTQPLGHKGPHTSVIDWAEVNDKKRS